MSLTKGMSTGPSIVDTVPDSERRGLIGALPAVLRPYASLMRIDRPIGTWLLFWPCAWGVALSGLGLGLLLAFAVGAFVMRSAGCVYNDIVDRDLDQQVERTRLRPLASGRVSVGAAWALVIMLCLVGLVVLLDLPRLAQLVALVSRAATGGLDLTAWWLWFGSIFWVIGYDTLYAIQDIEDDALVGVRSSARRMGTNVRAGVAICYALALAGWGAAIWRVRPDPVALLSLLPAAIHLAAQASRANSADGAGALALFRSNRWCGALVFAAMLIVGLSVAA